MFRCETNLTMSQYGEQTIEIQEKPPFYFIDTLIYYNNYSNKDIRQTGLNL